MKKLFLTLIFLPAFVFGEGPILNHKEHAVQQEFENVYQDIRTVLTERDGNRCIDDPVFCIDTVNDKVVISTLSITGEATIDGELTVATITATQVNASTIAVTGDVTIDGTMTSETANVTQLNVSTISATGDVTVDGTMTSSVGTMATGNVTQLNVSTISATGDVTIDGTMTSSVGTIATGNITQLNVSTIIATGEITAEGTVTVPAGSAAAPGLVVGPEDDNGFYWRQSDILGISLGGTLYYSIGKGNFSMRVAGSQILVQDGTVGVVGLGNYGDGNTGIYFPAVDTMATSAGGAEGIRTNSIGAVTQANQPSFLATAPLNTADQTGDGSVNIIEYDTEIFDLNNDFNTGTFTFASPVAGGYQFNAHALMQNLTSSHNYIQITIVTSNRNYAVYNTHLINYAYNSVEISVLADMDANDTAYVNVVVGGAGKTIEAISSAQYNTFSGSLIN